MNIVEELRARLPGLEKVNSLEDIVLFLIEQVQRKETDSFETFFQYVEQQLIFANREVADRLIVELLEALKNQSSLRDMDYAIFENWIGPETHVAWRWLEKKWKGKTSLRDTASGL
ncbi:hypothetical protein L0222_29430 [bacterium]|nr:hypothetical protein [bacterium]MCI0604693.1 hypothetical protein [bacterium]